ncbi:MAG: PorV/PorQ family protein [candidate division FCPU426 bacterium]
MKPLLLIGLGLGLTLAAPQVAPAGQDAGSDSVLEMGAGARAVAMGRTGVVEDQSAYAAQWNPGSLGFLPRPAAAVQHAALFGDARHESLAVVYPTLDYGTFSLILMRLDLAGVEGRDADNLPTGEFSFVEQQASLGYGYPVWGPLSLGAALKVHDLRLAGYAGTGVGVDAGALARFPLETVWLEEVAVAAACRNLVGPSLRLHQETDRLPAGYRAGAAARFSFIDSIPDSLWVRAEAEKGEQSDWRLHAGVEYSLYDSVAVRGGWDQEYFSAGAGVTYAGFSLDYAVSFPVLGLRHLVTLSVALGKDMAAQRAERTSQEEKRRQEIVANLQKKIIADYRRQAQASAAKRDFSEAAKGWEKILDWDPNDAEAREQLAVAQREIIRQQNAQDIQDAQEQMRKQEYIDVLVSCQQVLERDPENEIAKALYDQAEKKASRLGSYSLNTNFKQLENIREEYQLGLKAYTQRRFSEAITHWEKVIETTPLQKQVYRYLQSARQRVLAAQEKKTAPTAPAEPTKQQKLYKEAVEQSRNGNLKAAVRTWEKLVKENPEDQDAKQNFEETRKNLIDSQKKGISW